MRTSLLPLRFSDGQAARPPWTPRGQWDIGALPAGAAPSQAGDFRPRPARRLGAALVSHAGRVPCWRTMQLHLAASSPAASSSFPSDPETPALSPVPFTKRWPRRPCRSRSVRPTFRRTPPGLWHGAHRIGHRQRICSDVSLKAQARPRRSAPASRERAGAPRSAQGRAARACARSRSGRIRCSNTYARLFIGRSAAALGDDAAARAAFDAGPALAGRPVAAARVESTGLRSRRSRRRRGGAGAGLGAAPTLDVPSGDPWWIYSRCRRGGSSTRRTRPICRLGAGEAMPR